uniref:FIST_C domain-containing protein n=1 Tax=Macrostomum lignano TaxID=282301 RepID=A0A1I8FL65_9PLAT
LVKPGWRRCASSNPLEQFSVATRVVAYSSRNDLARLCQVSQLWQRRGARSGGVAVRSLSTACWRTSGHAGPGQRDPLSLSYAELAKRFGLLLTELRADWHLPYRLLVFCDVEFLRAKLAATAGEMAEAEPGFAACQRSRRRPADASSSASSSSSTESAGRGSSHLQALKAFAAAELPPGARLHLAGSFAGAIGHPEGAAGVPVEMETGKSSDVRQMHGLAHVRLYTCPGDDPRRFGVASAGEPLPPGASPKLLLALPNRNGNRRSEQASQSPEPPMKPDRMLGSITAAGWCSMEIGCEFCRPWSRCGGLGEDSRSLKLSSLQPLLPGQCLAFMFICCAKGSKHYLDQPDIETGVFSRAAAGVPVLGLFSEASSAGTARLGSVWRMCPARHLA